GGRHTRFSRDWSSDGCSSDLRERRLAELERERAEQAGLAGAVTGALLGSVGARARVETPAGEGEVEARVDGQAVGEAVAEQALPDRESGVEGRRGGAGSVRAV